MMKSKTGLVILVLAIIAVIFISGCIQQQQKEVSADFDKPVKLKIGEMARFRSDVGFGVTFSNVVQDTRWCGGRMPLPDEKAVVQFVVRLAPDSEPSTAPQVLVVDEFAERNFNLPTSQFDYKIKVNSLQPANCGGDIEVLKRCL